MSIRAKKTYLRTKNRRTGRMQLLHRQVAEQVLNRPLWPGEVVHHRDGDSTNNRPENLLVLPSQRFHAHAEHVLRQERRGQFHLFPDMLRSVREHRPGTLFEHLALE